MYLLFVVIYLKPSCPDPLDHHRINVFPNLIKYICTETSKKKKNSLYRPSVMHATYTSLTPFKKA